MRFAKTTRERKAAGIAAPQETEDGYLFASDLNMPRRFEVLAGMLSEPRAQRETHREDPGRQSHAGVRRDVEGVGKSTR